MSSAVFDFRQTNASTLAVLLLAASIIVITAAWGFELLGGYNPCPLCLQQRFAYYAVIPASALSLYLISSGQSGLARIVLALCALAFAINAGLGIYHSGVEWKFWAGPADCSGNLAGDITGGGNLLESLRDVRVIRCDEAPWRLMGISFAGYNTIISLGLSGLALAAMARLNSVQN